MRALRLYVATGRPCGGLVCCAGHVSCDQAGKAPVSLYLKIIKAFFCFVACLSFQKVLSLNMVSTWSSEFYQLHTSESACDRVCLHERMRGSLCASVQGIQSCNHTPVRQGQ